ncbi:UNVERIFIED_CONTAM: hypothetical protein GTU68_029915 [Idotea baltica]|nr:hypothetical protein [Idotea baltica]
MSQVLKIHPINPQERLIKKSVEIVRQGGVIIYPTNSSYALACGTGHKQAIERIRRIRQLDEKHNFTLICQDLSQLSTFSQVDTNVFRLLKKHTPGPYTFILNATRNVPRLLMHPKKRTIGLRIPSHPIAQALLHELGEALISVSLILPNDDKPLTEPEEMQQRLKNQVDLIIDSGAGGIEASTIIDFTNGSPEILRSGKGDPSLLMADF